MIIKINYSLVSLIFNIASKTFTEALLDFKIPALLTINIITRMKINKTIKILS